jgi:XapX domain-containing protein
MKPFLLSFVVGWGVGLLYAALRVKSPAPPLVALLGLLAMVLGEESFHWLVPIIRSQWK